jgi:hypothetical protein
MHTINYIRIEFDRQFIREKISFFEALRLIGVALADKINKEKICFGAIKNTKECSFVFLRCEDY